MHIFSTLALYHFHESINRSFLISIFIEMVKQRRQTDYGSSTDEEDVKSNNARNLSDKTTCTHISKSLDFTRMRKKLRETGAKLNSCPDCTDKVEEVASDFEIDLSLWLCLRCGSQLCGRSLNQHALKHFNTPRSDSHALVANTTTWEIWCYSCDNTVNVPSKSKLQECVDVAKKELEQPSSITNVTEKIKDTAHVIQTFLGKDSDDKTRSLVEPKLNLEPITDINLLPRVRGLSNLGNTCFFNAVLQCLAQTPYLLDILYESAEKGEKFVLPGGDYKLSDGKVTTLQPIEGELKQWGPLTEALAETLKELQSPGGVFTPRRLLQQLTHKWPQFGGGDQHDSHELLRHLLESVRSEDLRRYQEVVLKSLGYSTKVDPQTVEVVIKERIKLYGDQAADRILRPEQVFRGFLVSTLTCQECYHTSSRHESFLDISLPVTTESPKPPCRLANESNSSSKSLYKKQKEKEKKAKKNPKGSSKKVSKTHDNSENNDDQANKSSSSSSSSNELSDDAADIEDNLTDDTPQKASNPEKNDDKPEKKNKESLNPSTSTEDSSNVQDIDTIINSMDLNEDEVKNNQKKINRRRTVSHSDWNTTMSTKYQSADGECSVQSCLNCFTGLELMTGNNKVSCEACTEKINGKNGKPINTNATKQFLISSPPAVLILHLKRFQIGPRCMFRKLTKPVSFPLVLDIAPFCGSKVKKLPSILPHQKKLMYSLYGVVEHSGGMHGGHYVAYVKVRPKLSKTDDRRKFLPKGSKAELDQTDEDVFVLNQQLEKTKAREEMRLHQNDSDDSLSSSTSSDTSSNNDGNEQSKDDLEGAVGFTDPSNVTPPPGKWYYVSDSRVQETSEKEVLNAQAYLLFYERIF